MYMFHAIRLNLSKNGYFFFQSRFYYVALLVVWAFKSVIKSVVVLVAAVGCSTTGEGRKNRFFFSNQTALVVCDDVCQQRQPLAAQCARRRVVAGLYLDFLLEGA